MSNEMRGGFFYGKLEMIGRRSSCGHFQDIFQNWKEENLKNKYDHCVNLFGILLQ
jgi:hypothetical protein